MKYSILLLLLSSVLFADVYVGADVLFEKGAPAALKGKRVGLITNQSAVNRKLQTTFDLLKEHAKKYTVAAVFTPEHGFYGDAYACESVDHQEIQGVPIYSLHGSVRRPTAEMLKGIDLLVYDIQDIGSRSYTFVSTLFYCMEEAAKFDIPVIVLDRPNPMGGVVVDGPLIEEKWRSFLGYANIPYCHGMTIGELAHFFNTEHQVGCDLTVISMRGWKRGMTFADTGLPWVPTSPQIPEPDTPFFYPTTGLLGHCSLVNIGIGYTLPFKLVGAPWIQADQFAAMLNGQKLPGVQFQPYYYRPFFGKFHAENCQGVRVVITDTERYLPITTQFTIMGVLKNLYPRHFSEALGHMMGSKSKIDVFHKLNGSEEVLYLLQKERFIIWKLREKCANARTAFLPIRAQYLLY
ncbi:MAG: hypothetical protein S4CHLAM2_15230 [Chlamydiales bacterium]|nr:hypothetical protein [Chlamydiales bacterium]